jgi:hypothetical protein
MREDPLALLLELTFEILKPLAGGLGAFCLQNYRKKGTHLLCLGAFSEFYLTNQISLIIQIRGTKAEILRKQTTKSLPEQQYHRVDNRRESL